jgi:hypothetical protein
VPVDPERLARFAQGGIDLKALVGEQVEVVVAPQPPEVVESPEAAAAQAGITAQLPTVLPGGTEIAETRLSRAASFRVRLDTARLQALAEAAGADEIEIPAHWTGATVDVDVPPVVAVRYTRTIEATDTRPAREERFVLLQSAVPEVELPEGVELATLGRLGLRLAGMSAEEARSFAGAIDWRTTLLVPVPVRGGTFREVEVSGHKGLLVIVEPQKDAPAGPSGQAPRAHAVVMWSTGDKVLALQGPATRRGIQLVEMAESVR